LEALLEVVRAEVTDRRRRSRAVPLAEAARDVERASADGLVRIGAVQRRDRRRERTAVDVDFDADALTERDARALIRAAEELLAVDVGGLVGEERPTARGLAPRATDQPRLPPFVLHVASRVVAHRAQSAHRVPRAHARLRR